LFFREDFKAPPQGIQEMPMHQGFIENPNLELKRYGPGKELDTRTVNGSTTPTSVRLTVYGSP
jgi:hypothetical protein